MFKLKFFLGIKSVLQSQAGYFISNTLFGYVDLMKGTGWLKFCSFYLFDYWLITNPTWGAVWTFYFELNLLKKSERFCWGG